MRPWILAMLLALSVAGCATTPMTWAKADGGDANAGTDLADCRRLARDEMWRLGWERMWPPRFYDPRFMPPHYMSRYPFWFDYPMSLEREQALVEFCMHSKGYRLEALHY